MRARSLGEASAAFDADGARVVVTLEEGTVTIGALADAESTIGGAPLRPMMSVTSDLALRGGRFFEQFPYAPDDFTWTADDVLGVSLDDLADRRQANALLRQASDAAHDLIVAHWDELVDGAIKRSARLALDRESRRSSRADQLVAELVTEKERVARLRNVETSGRAGATMPLEWDAIALAVMVEVKDALSAVRPEAS